MVMSLTSLVRQKDPLIHHPITSSTTGLTWALLTLNLIDSADKVRQQATATLYWILTILVIQLQITLSLAKCGAFSVRQWTNKVFYLNYLLESLHARLPSFRMVYFTVHVTADLRLFFDITKTYEKTFNVAIATTLALLTGTAINNK